MTESGLPLASVVAILGGSLPRTDDYEAIAEAAHFFLWDAAHVYDFTLEESRLAAGKLVKGFSMQQKRCRDEFGMEDVLYLVFYNAPCAREFVYCMASDPDARLTLFGKPVSMFQCDYLSRSEIHQLKKMPLTAGLSGGAPRERLDPSDPRYRETMGAHVERLHWTDRKSRITRLIYLSKKCQDYPRLTFLMYSNTPGIQSAVEVSEKWTKVSKTYPVFPPTLVALKQEHLAASGPGSVSMVASAGCSSSRVATATVDTTVSVQSIAGADDSPRAARTPAPMDVDVSTESSLEWWDGRRQPRGGMEPLPASAPTLFSSSPDQMVARDALVRRVEKQKSVERDGRRYAEAQVPDAVQIVPNAALTLAYQGEASPAPPEASTNAATILDQIELAARSAALSLPEFGVLYVPDDAPPFDPAEIIRAAAAQLPEAAAKEVASCGLARCDLVGDVGFVFSLPCRRP